MLVLSHVLSVCLIQMVSTEEHMQRMQRDVGCSIRRHLQFQPHTTGTDGTDVCLLLAAPPPADAPDHTQMFR